VGSGKALKLASWRLLKKHAIKCPTGATVSIAYEYFLII
jgi:hypothetical protein